MRAVVTRSAAALACCAALLAAGPSARPLWVGELRIGETNRLVELKLSVSEDGPAGTIRYSAIEGSEVPLSGLSFEKGGARFAWRDGNDDLAFEGSLSEDLITGTVRRAKKKTGTLQLVPVVRLERPNEERLAGYYELEPGHVLSVTSFPFGPVYLDYQTGRVGVLFPSSQETFFAGPAFQVPFPAAVRARLDTKSDSTVAGLFWKSEVSPELQARRLALRREEVVFKNGDVSLSGTLTLPDGAGPHPAIVRIHGAGGQTRRNVVDGWYARNGVAYLSYDKRGAGKSTGDWKEAGLSELAGDVDAALLFLRARKDIDGARIGIEGNSEGGWVAPIVAARDDKLAFIILLAGPALDFVAELMNEVEEGLRSNGLGGDDLAKALAFKRQAFERLKNGAGASDEAWQKFQEFLEPYRKEEWFRYVGEPRQRTWAQKKFSLMAQRETLDLWRRVRVPVLALYGGKDLNVPAQKNVAALESELRQAGNRDFTIKVLENANHDGLETTRARLGPEEERRLIRYVPGYFSTRLEWTLSRVQVRKPGG